MWHSKLRHLLKPEFIVAGLFALAMLIVPLAFALADYQRPTPCDRLVPILETGAEISSSSDKWTKGLRTKKIIRFQVSKECLKALDQDANVSKTPVEVTTSANDLGAGSDGPISNCSRAKKEALDRAKEICINKGFTNGITQILAPNSCESGGLVAKLIARQTYTLTVRCGRLPLPTREPDPQPKEVATAGTTN